MAGILKHPRWTPIFVFLVVFPCASGFVLLARRNEAHVLGDKLSRGQIPMIVLTGFCCLRNGVLDRAQGLSLLAGEVVAYMAFALLFAGSMSAYNALVGFDSEEGFPWLLLLFLALGIFCCWCWCKILDKCWPRTVLKDQDDMTSAITAEVV